MHIEIIGFELLKLNHTFAIFADMALLVQLRGPTTIEGLIVTRSTFNSLASFQASVSAAAFSKKAFNCSGTNDGQKAHSMVNDPDFALQMF